MWVFAQPWRQIQRHSITNMIVAIILYEVLYISLCLRSKLNYQSQIFMWRNRFYFQGRCSSAVSARSLFTSPVFAIKFQHADKYSYLPVVYQGWQSKFLFVFPFSFFFFSIQRKRSAAGPLQRWCNVFLVAGCFEWESIVSVCVLKGSRWECCWRTRSAWNCYLSQ